MIRERLEHIARNPATLPLLLVMALFFRWVRLDTQELGIDEMITALEANGIFMEGLAAAGEPFTREQLSELDKPINVMRSNMEMDGGNGLLFAFGLHGWKEMFGNGTIAWRSLSVLLGVLSILLVHRTLLAFGGTQGSALLAAAFAALNAQFVDYSQEVRGYMLGVVLVLSTVLFAMHASERSRPRWFDGPLLGCLAAGALFSHYFTAYILLPFAVWYWVGRRSRSSLYGSLVAVLIPMVAMGLWAAHLGGDGLQVILGRNQEIVDLVKTSGGDALFPAITWGNALQGLSYQFLSMAGTMTRDLEVYKPPVFIVLPVILFLAFLGARYGRHGVLLLLLASAAPINGLLLSSYTGHAVALRAHYAMFSAPFMIMLLAMGADHLLANQRWGRIAWALPLLLVLATGWGTVQVWKGTNYLGPDRCSLDAWRIEETLTRTPDGNYQLVYGSRMAASIVGLHLLERAREVSSVIRTMDHTVLLVRSNPSDTLIIR